MLRVEDFVKIRELHFKDGLGIKEIARTFHYSRKFVRKAIRTWNGESRYRQTKPRPRPKATPEVYEYVRAILEADPGLPRKQRHTARRIWKRAAAEKPDWALGESTMRAVVSQVRQDLRKRPAVTIPLWFEPGEEAQVDFGESQVWIQGEQVKAHVLMVTLCFSRRVFAMAFPAPNQEAFLAGHVEAFRHFGGIPNRLAYDNLSAAVKKILAGNGREENPTFLAFRGLYCFEPRFCSPGKEGAHEKGRVERKVGSYRLEMLAPPPKFDTWDELNRYLLGCCLELDASAHPENRDRTVLQAFEEERERLRPLPAHHFKCVDSRCAQVDSQSRIVYKTVRYSVPCEFGGRQVEVRASWDRVDVYHGTTLIAAWPRSYKPGDERYDYRHYLKALRYTPGASLNGKPFRELPGALLAYRKELLERYERRVAGRYFARVLRLLLEQPEKSVLDAVELAMLLGTVDAAAVVALVDQLLNGPRKPMEKLDISSRQALQEVKVKRLDLGRYDALMRRSSA